MIELIDGQVAISDLKSHNGTWVNGKRITAPAILKHGDKIRLGDTVLRLRVGDRSLPPLDVEVGPSKARRLGYGSLSVGGFAVVIVLMLGLLIVWPSIRD
ncbi:MAG: FHA domain-containing protein, partial [Anaerolineales bacterium]|nr:FHA domain-containing protein [Anaerolineales bacterium]